MIVVDNVIDCYVRVLFIEWFMYIIGIIKNYFRICVVGFLYVGLVIVVVGFDEVKFVRLLCIVFGVIDLFVGVISEILWIVVIIRVDVVIGNGVVFWQCIIEIYVQDFVIQVIYILRQIIVVVIIGSYEDFFVSGDQEVRVIVNVVIRNIVKDDGFVCQFGVVLVKV